MDKYDTIIADFMAELSEYIEKGVEYNSSVLISLDLPDVLILYEAFKSKGFINT